MDLTSIHVLLLDGRMLFLHITKNVISLDVRKVICEFLGTSHNSTYGLMYLDARGGRRWLADDRAVMNHDFASYGEVIQLVFKIKHVPHCLCVSNKGNIVQLFQHGVRLLRKRWFIMNPKINSQLIALYLLVHHRSELNTSRIRDLLKEELPNMDLNAHLKRSSRSSSVQTLGHSLVTNEEEEVDDENSIYKQVENAYQIYQSKLQNTAEVVLKFLHLMTKFPIFTSEVYVVKRRNNESFCLGISSQYLTLFKLDSYQNPTTKIPIKTIDQVMVRKVKVVVTLNTFSRSTDCLSNRSNIPSNDLIDFYALSSYQSICIKKNIETAKLFSIKYSNINNKLCSDCNGIIRIGDIIKDDKSFQTELDDWFNKYLLGSLNDNCFKRPDGIYLEMADETDEFNKSELESQFGEDDLLEKEAFYDEFIKQDLIPNTPNIQTNKSASSQSRKNAKPKIRLEPNFNTMVKEKERLEYLLEMKKELLKENFNDEQEITGELPKEYYTFFPQTDRSEVSNSLFYSDTLKSSDRIQAYSTLNSSRYTATTSRIHSSRLPWNPSTAKGTTCRSMIQKKRTPDNGLVGHKTLPQRMPSPYSTRSASINPNQNNYSYVGSPIDSLSQGNWCNSSNGSVNTEYYESREELMRYGHEYSRPTRRNVPTTLQKQFGYGRIAQNTPSSSNTLGVYDEFRPVKPSSSASDLRRGQFKLESPSDQSISPVVNDNSVYSNLTVYTLSPNQNQNQTLTNQSKIRENFTVPRISEASNTSDWNSDSVFSQEDLV